MKGPEDNLIFHMFIAVHGSWNKFNTPNESEICNLIWPVPESIASGFKKALQENMQELEKVAV